MAISIQNKPVEQRLSRLATLLRPQTSKKRLAEAILDRVSQTMSPRELTELLRPEDTATRPRRGRGNTDRG